MYRLPTPRDGSRRPSATWNVTSESGCRSERASVTQETCESPEAGRRVAETSDAEDTTRRPVSMIRRSRPRSGTGIESRSLLVLPQVTPACGPVDEVLGPGTLCSPKPERLRKRDKSRPLIRPLVVLPVVNDRDHVLQHPLFSAQVQGWTRRTPHSISTSSDAPVPPVGPSSDAPVPPVGPSSDAPAPPVGPSSDVPTPPVVPSDPKEVTNEGRVPSRIKPRGTRRNQLTRGA